MKSIVIIRNILSYFIATIFIYALLQKIKDIDIWTDKINSFDIVSKFDLYWLSYIIIAMEIIAILLLIFDFVEKIAAYYSFSLVSLYTGYVYYKIYISQDGDCPCGGIFNQLSMTEHLWVNLALMISSAVLILLDYRLQINKMRNSND